MHGDGNNRVTKMRRCSTIYRLGALICQENKSTKIPNRSESSVLYIHFQLLIQFTTSAYIFKLEAANYLKNPVFTPYAKS